jgi:sugar/nucleoside kinase (ribokinase family)
LEQVTVFKSSEMELAHLVGGRDTLTRLERICECGVEVAMATRGRGGAYLVDRLNAFHIPAAVGRRVVDPTGAGDVFFGTFLSAYLRGEDSVWCASKGAALASALIETRGSEVKASIGEVVERAEEVYEGTRRL